ncbi:MFS transporter [Robiginitomaculum antarcticum]|uniref:MFS transporter n=1 Tax=Robiginitomaculum antarcticum TaxID=437507 RepID=UPI00036879E7|nr:MFS transporter [Robiginitomaculum antarcticum]
MATDTMDMKHGINPDRLFLLSCISLIVTAMTFAIRAGILGQLNETIGLTDTELGFVNAMAFLGFPLAMVLLGYLYTQLGPRLIMILAFAGHLLGLILTMAASGFLGLLVSTFFIGFANGSVEAACNPMIADMYKNNKSTMLNRFHVWFPGGIVIGAVIAYIMGTKLDMSWQSQIGIMLIPTAIYGYMIFTTQFPERIKSSPVNVFTLLMLIAVMALLALFALVNLSPALAFIKTVGGKLAVLAIVFVLLAVLLRQRGNSWRDVILLFVMMALMTLTTTSELGTQQWVERILGSTGASSMLVLAMVTGLMAVGRFFAGPVIHALNPVGVLLMSAVVTSAGLFLMSIATGGMIYLAAIVFAIGVCYFWPTMVGFVSEYIPRSGALGMSLLGASGMFALTFWNPVIGGWIDAARKQANAAGVTGDAAEVVAGQTAMSNLALFPLILILAFVVLFVMRKQVAAGAGEHVALTKTYEP